MQVTHPLVYRERSYSLQMLWLATKGRYTSIILPWLKFPFKFSSFLFPLLSMTCWKSCPQIVNSFYINRPICALFIPQVLNSCLTGNQLHKYLEVITTRYKHGRFSAWKINTPSPFLMFLIFHHTLKCKFNQNAWACGPLYLKERYI